MSAVTPVEQPKLMISVLDYVLQSKCGRCPEFIPESVLKNLTKRSKIKKKITKKNLLIDFYSLSVAGLNKSKNVNVCGANDGVSDCVSQRGSTVNVHRMSEHTLSFLSSSDSGVRESRRAARRRPARSIRRSAHTSARHLTPRTGGVE